MKQQEVFNELYETLERGMKPSEELVLLAQGHGIRVGAVEEAVLAAQEDDFDE